ncbi:hypothetical protein NM208_g533 [Fusarium decemcellulare]|uniref:Uncharacterized protein n=1 Tax=Fusarium decemcellulare TaxID=57161 RepID=A0ACC1SZD8_9HYPO|nr:hypothetical protein NM208_g533 [Fusarium decemcellulare]
MSEQFLGQRYHIVLHADPINRANYTAAADGNYWIRTVPADLCKGFENGNELDERQGILRYNASSTDVPTTWRPGCNKTCRDEEYKNLVPIHRWNVTPVELNTRDTNKDLKFGLENVTNRPEHGDAFKWWAFGEKPLWLNFSDPTITRLDSEEA